MVKIFDTGQLLDGTLYLLMEFLEGETVAARLLEGGSSRQPLAESVTLRLGRQIASALAVAHGRGIAHRGRMPATPCVDKAPPRFSCLSRAAGKTSVTLAGHSSQAMDANVRRALLSIQ